MRSSSRRLSSSSWRADRSAGLASPSLSLSCCFCRFCFCCFCDFCCDFDDFWSRDLLRDRLRFRLWLRLREREERDELRERLPERLPERLREPEERDRPRELPRELLRERDPLPLALPFRPLSPFVRPPLPPLPPNFGILGSLPFGSLMPLRLGNATLSSSNSSRLRSRYCAAIVACNCSWHTSPQ